MFRTQRGVTDPHVDRTFDSVRRVLAPTLYTKHFYFQFGHHEDAVSGEDGTGGAFADFDGPMFPIPHHFDPATGAEKKAWSLGSMEIIHLTTGITRTLTAKIFAVAVGAAPVVLATNVMALGGAAVLQKFSSYLTAVDLSTYYAIGCRYSIDAGTADPIVLSTSVTWRPNLV